MKWNLSNLLSTLILIVLVVIAVELHTLQNYVSGTTDGVYTLISAVNSGVSKIPSQ